MQVAKACDVIEGLHYFHTSNMVWANHETHIPFNSCILFIFRFNIELCSANIPCQCVWCSTHTLNRMVNSTDTKGPYSKEPDTDPWGMPDITGEKSEHVPFTTTLDVHGPWIFLHMQKPQWLSLIGYKACRWSPILLWMWRSRIWTSGGTYSQLP